MAHYIFMWKSFKTTGGGILLLQCLNDRLLFSLKFSRRLIDLWNIRYSRVYI